MGSGRRLDQPARRRDESRWTLVQGILAPLQFLVFAISLWLVLLSTFLTPISILLSWKYIDHRVKEFFEG